MLLYASEKSSITAYIHRRCVSYTHTRNNLMFNDFPRGTLIRDLLVSLGDYLRR